MKPIWHLFFWCQRSFLLQKLDCAALCLVPFNASPFQLTFQFSELLLKSLLNYHWWFVLIYNRKSKRICNLVLYFTRFPHKRFVKWQFSIHWGSWSLILTGHCREIIHFLLKPWVLQFGHLDFESLEFCALNNSWSNSYISYVLPINYPNDLLKTVERSNWVFPLLCVEKV